MDVTWKVFATFWQFKMVAFLLIAIINFIVVMNFTSEVWWLSFVRIQLKIALGRKNQFNWWFDFMSPIDNWLIYFVCANVLKLFNQSALQINTFTLLVVTQSFCLRTFSGVRVDFQATSIYGNCEGGILKQRFRYEKSSKRMSYPLECIESTFLRVELHRKIWRTHLV